MAHPCEPISQSETCYLLHAIVSVPRSEPDSLYVALNDRDKAWHDLYKVRISTGERTLMRQNNDHITGWVFDLKDQLRMATRVADNGDTEVLRVDDKGFTKVIPDHPPYPNYHKP